MINRCIDFLYLFFGFLLVSELKYLMDLEPMNLSLHPILIARASKLELIGNFSNRFDALEFGKVAI